MNYNIIDEPWVHVEYLDGKRGVLSVRDVLKNSLKIKRLVTPKFSGNQCYLYEYCALEFLTNLVLASYYKPEQNFAPKRSSWKEPLKKDGLYSPVVESYLKKYYDRFNLFDEEHPFLQDASMRPEKFGEGNSYLAMMNPVGPASGAPIFGQWASRGKRGDVLSGFKISFSEFPYLILYHNSIAHNPNAANYYGTIRGSAKFFAVPIGDNLCETILKNCCLLNNSDRPDDDAPNARFDRPVWELDDIAEAFEYPAETLHNNILLCTYYPSKFLIAKPGDDGYISSIYMPRKPEIDKKYPKKRVITSILSELYPLNDPNAIHKKHKEKKNDNKNAEDGNKKKMPLYGYVSRNSFKAWTLLIDATAKISEDNFACPILAEQSDNEFCTVSIYYRILDDNNANLWSTALVYLPDKVNLKELMKKENYEKMTKIQNFCSGIHDKYYDALKEIGISKVSRKDEVKSFDSWTETYMYDKFIKNINDDIYLTGCRDIINCVKERILDIALKMPKVNFVSLFEQKDKFDNILRKENKKCKQ